MIAVTGTGVVSPLAVGSAAFMQALHDGHSAIRALEPELGIAVGARFRSPFQADIERKQAFLMDPVSQYAVVAGREAYHMAGLEQLPSPRVGAIIGIGICGIESIDTAYRQLYAGNGRVKPFAIPKIMPSAPASHVATELGIHGPAFCTTSACASAGHAIISGALWLEAGLVDAVLVGGAEAPFAYGLLRAWDAMQVLADDTCRPFSFGRKGMVLGEGAGVLVLERLDYAQARGAEVLAVLQGFAASADARHIVQPDQQSIARTLAAALEHAGVAANAVQHINAHATGTELNDRLEAQALAEIFPHRPWISATKGATGHALGASTALQAITCVHALKQQWIPPTLNCLTPDPEIADIRISPAQATPASYSLASCNAFAFGGLNSVLVFAAA